MVYPYIGMRLLLMAMGLALVGLTLADEKYTDRYDNLNIQEILDNKRLLTSYVKCILDQGRCTAEGKELKKNIVDAMQHSCEKCTPWQRSNARKIVKHLREKETASWEQLKKKYDPDSTYQPLYEAFLAADD